MPITIEKNIMVPMRDGVRLATDLYRAADQLSTPALVLRLPYDKERQVSPELMTFVKAGYAIVVQGHARPLCLRKGIQGQLSGDQRRRRLLRLGGGTALVRWAHRHRTTRLAVGRS